METSANRGFSCPYCGRPLVWVPLRWFGRGCFECEACGEFADFRVTSVARLRHHSAPTLSRRLPKRDARPRVLLVDDSPEQRDLYALMLESIATVVTASRGEEALSIAVAEPLDAIVLDVLMPGMDGWEVCRRVKNDPRTSGVPVIMLTSLDRDETNERAQRAGAAAVLTKPCPVERLALAIRTAMPEPHPLALKASRTPKSLIQPGTRRWARKPVTSPLAACVDDQPARLMNVSYGGLCLALEPTVGGVASSFDVRLAMPDLSIHAEAVWMNRSGRLWLCGAELAHIGDEWRQLVDSVA